MRGYCTCITNRKPDSSVAVRVAVLELAVLHSLPTKTKIPQGRWKRQQKKMHSLFPWGGVVLYVPEVTPEFQPDRRIFGFKWVRKHALSSLTS